MPAPDPNELIQRRLERSPPAFRLALACAMWPPSPARDAKVREAARGIDWDAFVRVLARQRIFGQAAAALAAAGVTVPQGPAGRIAKAAKSIAMQNWALTAEALRLRAQLEAAGIPTLFIKGAALAQLAYGAQTLKHCRDIDLLVKPADAERAFELLLADGYVNVAPKGELSAADRKALFRLHKDVELVRGPERTQLELHWRLIENAALLKGVGVGSPAQEVEVPGGRLATLADPDLFAYLCVHGASHCWFRLKWLADLAAWLTSKTDAEVAGFYERARALGVEACAEEALILCRGLLDYRPPPTLMASLSGLRARLMVRAALDMMIGRDAETELNDRPFGTFRLLPAQYLRGRGAGFLFAQCGLLFESLEDRLTFPLPAPARFLYPLLRLPFWLLRIARRRQAARAAGVSA